MEKTPNNPENPESQSEHENVRKRLPQISGKFPTYQERDMVNNFGYILEDFEKDLANYNAAIEPWLEEVRELIAKTAAYHSAKMKEAGME